MNTTQRTLLVIAAAFALPVLLFQLAPQDTGRSADMAPTAPLAVYDDTPQQPVTAKGRPELFRDIHYDIRAGEDGKIHYPMGYQISEYRKAVAAAKNQGTTLNWVERGPGNVGGRTRPILMDPDAIDQHTWFVGTAGGGLWWTQNRGYAWGYLTDNLPNLSVSALGMAESDHNIMYIGTGEGFGNLDGVSGSGVFKSYDRGQTWEHLLSTATDTLFQYVNRLAIDPMDPDVVVVATNHGIQRTTDGGMTWTEVYSGPGAGNNPRSRIQDLKAQPGNFNTMIAGENPGGILHSMDGGLTWAQAITSDEMIGGSQRIELAYAPSNPAIAYASVQTGFNSAELLRSDDGGASWSLTREADPSFFGPLNWLGGQGWYDNAIAVHPFAPDTVFLGGIQMWRALMTGGTTDLREPTNFQGSLPGQQDIIIGYIIGLGSHLGGLVLTGLSDSLTFTDISEPDYSTVEIRYGQGTQMAHRFTSNDSLSSDVACFFLPYDRNEYHDYVEVPFTAWDAATGRQLAVSFRDQGLDSTFSLINFNIEGPCNGVSNEQIFVHKYDYDASAPHDSIAQHAGLTRGLMYMVLPYLIEEETWAPDSLGVPPQTTRITYSRADGVYAREMDNLLDPTRDTHVDHHAILPVPIDEVSNDFWVLNTNDGGVSLSTDAGISFIETDLRFAGQNTGQFYGVDKRPGFAQYVGGTQDNGSWMSYGNPNNRRGWISVFGADGFEAIWHSRDQDKIIVTVQFNIHLWTHNRGADWNLNFFNDDFGIFLTSIDSSPLAPDTVYMIGLNGLWRSPDFALTWNLAPMDSAWAPTNIGKVRASSAADSIVWAGYGLDDSPVERTLWYSTDAGVSFTPAALPTIPRAPNTITSGLATHPSEAGTAYALFSRARYPKILETTDYGQTWQDISGFSESTTGASVRGFPDASVYDLLVLPHAEHVMWAGTDIGLFQTKSRGNEWNYAHNGLPAVSVYRLKYRDDEIVVATHGRGVWTVPWAEIDVSVDEDNISELPKSFSLEPNYPNPFNPSTTITFNMPEEAKVRITVFDVIGRKVATLTDQVYAAGTHEMVWDASSYASGVYFYRMEAAGKLIQTQKMMLVK